MLTPKVAGGLSAPRPKQLGAAAFQGDELYQSVGFENDDADFSASWPPLGRLHLDTGYSGYRALPIQRWRDAISRSRLLELGTNCLASSALALCPFAHRPLKAEGSITQGPWAEQQHAGNASSLSRTTEAW